jgi:hypothetical protein
MLIFSRKLSYFIADPSYGSLLDTFGSQKLLMTAVFTCNTGLKMDNMQGHIYGKRLNDRLMDVKEVRYLDTAVGVM